MIHFFLLKHKQINKAQLLIERVKLQSLLENGDFPLKEHEIIFFRHVRQRSESLLYGNKFKPDFNIVWLLINPSIVLLVDCS